MNFIQRKYLPHRYHHKDVGNKYYFPSKATFFISVYLGIKKINETAPVTCIYEKLFPICNGKTSHMSRK